MEPEVRQALPLTASSHEPWLDCLGKRIRNPGTPLGPSTLDDQVLHLGEELEVRLYRDLIASGIQDYLLKPLNSDMLRDAFSHAQTMLNAIDVDPLDASTTTVEGDTSPDAIAYATMLVAIRSLVQPLGSR